MNRYRLLRCSVVWILLIGAFGCSAQVDVAERPEPSASRKYELVDKELKGKLIDYLEDINKWIMTLDVGSGSLKNTEDTTWSIFINGNFARVLMASYKITGNKAYLDEGLRWCDTFYKQQQLSITSTMEEGGYWTDGPRAKNIYFGDAGSATTALAIGYRFADKKRQALYLKAMERYARFVTQGCLTDPQGLGRRAAKGWVIAQGKDKGALGCGYYRGHLSLPPYTIATATTGGAFFSELFAITSKQQYKDVAAGATRWLVGIRKKDGEIRYILDGLPEDKWDWPLDTITYCTEAFVAADTHLRDSGLRTLLRKELKSTVQWLLARQNPDGSWGKLRSADQQRSPRVVTLLTWYYRQVEPDAKVAESIRSYCHFLLNPENSQAYGAKELVRTTGFIGLAVAEIVTPGSTF